MVKKVFSYILLVIGLIVFLILTITFASAIIGCPIDYDKCIAEGVKSASECSASFGIGMAASLVFLVTVGAIGLGASALLNIIATLLYRFRKRFVKNNHFIALIVCCILPVVAWGILFGLGMLLTSLH